MKYFIFLFLCASSVYAGSLQIYNDSPYVLNVTVLGADGSLLGQAIVNPQNQFNWDNGIGGNADYSQTPYTVIWQCQEGTEYGIWTNAGPGALVTAQGSSGSRYCKPKKKSPSSTREQPLNQ